MNPAQQELFDLAILRVLDANRTRFGLSAAALGNFMGQEGFPSPNPDTVLDRIDYLARHGFVEEVAKTVNKANRAWRITDAGINHLDR